MFSERAPSMEKIPTIAQALAGVPISQSNNTLQAQMNQASSLQIKGKLSKSASRASSVKKSKKSSNVMQMITPVKQPEDIYQKDLGTMGIPREIA